MVLRRRQRNARRLGGTAMVEFVFVLPLLLILLFSIAEFGVVFGRWLTISNAAREGAREAIVFRTTCDKPTVETETRDKVKAFALSGGVALQDEQIEIIGACDGPGSTTSVRIDFLHGFRVLPNFVGALTPEIHLVGSSIMRNEATSS